MKDLLFFKKPIFFLLLTIAFFVIGMQFDVVGKCVFFFLGCMCFNHFYMVCEVYKAIYAHEKLIEHQIGFTNRNNARNILLNFIVILVILIAAVLLFDDIRAKLMPLIPIPVFGIYALLSMFSIDRRLMAGYNKFQKEKEQKEKENERLKESLK